MFSIHRSTFSVGLRRFHKGLLSRLESTLAIKQDEEEKYSHKVFELGDFRLQRGATLRNAKLAYKTWGSLSEDKSNAIVYPTWFSGRHWDNSWLIGSGMGLDPAKYFIIVPNMIGNGLSTSPSNSPPPFDKVRFPKVTMQDNVRAQHRLVTEEFGITKLKLVLGWSMGGGQTYQWAVSYPEMVERILPFCSAARTSPHNKVFLEGVKAALTCDCAFRSGWYDQLPVEGLRAAARVYAGWGFSQAFYWHETWRELGFTSLEDFLVGYWEGFFMDKRDPNNLLAMLWTWKHANVGLTAGFEGDLGKALSSIQARGITLPAEKDLYFPPEDQEYEAKLTKNVRVRVIPGIWGHSAGSGLNPVDNKFIDEVVKEVLHS